MKNECVPAVRAHFDEDVAQRQLSVFLGSPVRTEGDGERFSAPLCKGSCQAFQD